MILTDQELHRPVILPFEEDRATTARVASFFTLMFSAWFFGGPILFFGVSGEPLAWNHFLAGGTVLTLAICRLVWPRGTGFFGLINMVLGLWILCSPLIFGYTDNGSQLANSLVCGAVILVLSFLSRRHSSRLLATRSLASDNDEY